MRRWQSWTLPRVQRNSARTQAARRSFEGEWCGELAAVGRRIARLLRPLLSEETSNIAGV
jgi:hypothetical protein